MFSSKPTISFYHQVNSLTKQLDELPEDVQENDDTQLGARKNQLTFPMQTSFGRRLRMVATADRNALREELRKLADQSESKVEPKAIKERQVRKLDENETLTLKSVRDYLHSLQQTDAYIYGEKLNGQQTQILNMMQQSLKKALTAHGSDPGKIKDAVLQEVTEAWPGFDKNMVPEVMPMVLEALSTSNGDGPAREAIPGISAGVNRLLNLLPELNIPEEQKFHQKRTYNLSKPMITSYVTTARTNTAGKACALFLGILHYRHKHGIDDSTSKMADFCSKFQDMLQESGIQYEDVHYLEEILTVIPPLQDAYPGVDFEEFKKTVTIVKDGTKKPAAKSPPGSDVHLKYGEALGKTIKDQLRGIEMDTSTFPSLVCNPEDPPQSFRPGWLQECVRYQPAHGKDDPTESLTVDQYIRLKNSEKEPASLAASKPKYDINLVNPKDGRQFRYGQIQDLRLYILLYDYVENHLGPRSTELNRLKNIPLIEPKETPQEWLERLKTDRRHSRALLNQIEIFIRENMKKDTEWDENRLISGIDEEIQETSDNVRKDYRAIDEYQLMTPQRDSMEPGPLSQEGRQMLLDKYQFEVQTDDKILASGKNGTIENPDTAYRPIYDYEAENCRYHAFFPGGEIQAARVFLNRIKNEHKSVTDQNGTVIPVCHQQNIEIATAAVRNAGGILIQRPMK